MNTYGRVTSAFGSVVLNVVLALLLSQGAGAATPSTDPMAASAPGPVRALVVPHPSANAHCTSRLRTRTIVAVILGIIV